MGRSSLWIVGLSLCVVLHALGTDALAADAKKAAAPVADGATLVLLHFDKLPLKDASPLRNPIRAKDVALVEGRFGKALDCRTVGWIRPRLPAEAFPKNQLTRECWVRIQEYT